MLRAKRTFWAPGNRRVLAGDLVAPHDPVVKGRQRLFEAVVIPQALPPVPGADSSADDEDQAAEVAAVDPGADSGADDVEEAAEAAPDSDEDDDGGEASAPAARTASPRKRTARRAAGGGAK